MSNNEKFMIGFILLTIPGILSCTVFLILDALEFFR